MIRHLLFFLFIISFTFEAKSQECPTIPQVLESGEIILTSECSPFTFDKSLVISSGTKLTIGDGVTFNFTGSDKYIDVRGELVVGKGVTIKMGNGTYIKTEGEGLIDVNGVESDSVTFTGSNWRGIWTNNSNGSSSIKYSRIIQEKSNGGDWNDWFLLLSRTTLENSRISQARYGVSAAASTLKNNKIHNLKRIAAEIYGNSTATGNEIYDVNLDNSNQPAIWLWNNATFKSNRLFQSSNSTNNWGIYVGSNTVVESNTIGGSSGLHGSVGLAVHEDNVTIKNNNIGGYKSNLVIHGNIYNLVFENNNFIGEMNTSSGQSNVTIENGNSDIEGYNRGGRSYQSNILSLKIDLENNYWGNTSDIPSTINDYNDDIERKGNVDFEPVLSTSPASAPIQIPGGVTKAFSQNNVILSWDAVTASDLAGYKIYSKDGTTYTLIQNIEDVNATSFEISGGDIESSYVITSYDSDLDGTNDQLDGNESWYSSEFSKLSFSLSVDSDDKLTTVGDPSTYDKWLLANYDGDSAMFEQSYQRASDWSYQTYSDARARIENHCSPNCFTSDRGMVVVYNGWGDHSIVEVNALVNTLETTKSSGSYNYLGQHNGHSYFRSSWGNYMWSESRDQANNDGAYLVVINDDSEMNFLKSANADGWVGYYSEKEGNGYTMPGIWKWVEEIDPKSVFDIKLSEGTSQAVITATLDRLYSDDVTINLSTGGSTSVDEDYTISSTVISIPSGSISGTAVLTLVDDILDEDDSDTIKIEVGSSDFAVESVDQKILIAVEDDDEMPSVSLATSQTAIAENGGTSNLTATLSSVSGRDVKVNLRVSGTASSQDFTLNGDEIDIAEVLTDDLVLNYTFSGDASDGSSNGNDGTVYGATLTEDRFGEENSAFLFDGEDDHISIPNTESLQIEEDITLSAWIRSEANLNYHTEFVLHTQNSYIDFRLDRRDNNTRFQPFVRGAGSHEFIGANNNLANDEWVMVTFTSTKSDDENSKTKTFKIYVNGELQRTENKIGNRYDIDKNSPISIGSNSNGDWNHFKGALDDIRIYNKALTEEEVSNLYASQSVQDVNASIIIAKGSTTGSVEVKGIDDATDETDESIINSIISAVGASVSVNKTASLVITDDDVTSVSLSLDNQTIREGTNQYATVTATLDKVSELPVTVYLDGSGVDEADYSISTSNDTTGTVATLAAHYKFNGDANDETDNDHDGTVNGATLVEDRFGNAQSAMYFDGVDDVITVPYEGNLRIEREITINTWIKSLVNDSGDPRYITGPQEWFSLNIAERDNGEKFSSWGRLGGYWDTPGIECFNGNCSSRPDMEEWYMITYSLSLDVIVDEVTGQESERLVTKAYLNGFLWDERILSQFSNRDFNDIQGDMVIGALSNNQNHFKGFLDDVRIYSGALSDEDVKKLYDTEAEGENDNNSIVIPSGELSGSVYVFAVDDDLYEASQNLSISVGSADNADGSGSSPALISIVDNESMPSVSISSDKEYVGESEEFKNATITATSDVGAGDTIMVILEESGTATIDDDYELSSDTILILPGNSTGSVSITTLYLPENDPTEGEETITLSVSSVVGADENGDQSVTLNLTETSCENVEKELYSSITEDLTLFELCSPYSVPADKSLLRIREGYTVTIEDGAVLNLLGSEQTILVEGTLIIKGGATINMSIGSNIEVSDNGKLDIQGTQEKYAIITGENWRQSSSNSNGPSILLNSSVSSTIKYAKIINSNVTQNWLLSAQDGSTIENSEFSGGAYGVTLSNNSTIKDSKIYNFKYNGLELNNASATGNIIYDVNNHSNNDYGQDVLLRYNSTFSGNKIYSSNERYDNIAIWVDSDNTTIEFNTIGGSSGIHGAVGISMPYNRNSTIRYNNIGGYLANIALHGIDNGQNYIFENNNFIGSLSGNQRHVVVYNQGDRTDWHIENIPYYSQWGHQFGSAEEIDLSNNYWGTTNTSVIDDAIQDSEDDETYTVDGYVSYTPINTSASVNAPIQSPINLIKVVSGSDVILTWDAVTTTDLAGYKIYSIEGENYTLVQDIADANATSYTVTGGDFEDSYVITSYDLSTDGTNDQSDGNESWYSAEFTPISISLSVTSDDGLSTVGDLSTFDDAWVIQGWGGETEIYDDSYQRATDYTNAVAGLESHCYVQCEYNAETNSNSFTGLRVYSRDWNQRFLVEVNALVDSLSTTNDVGKYYYVGQFNGHSYFRSSWSSNWENAKTQANEDGAYLLVINDEDERQYLQSVRAHDYSPFVGYYRESSIGSDFTMPGVWKWVSEFDPISDIDLRLEESTGAAATITATIDKSYSQDVTITLSTDNGSASVDEDFTLGSQILTISQGELSASTSLTVQDDPLDEHDSDTVRIEVGSSNFAFASEDHELLIAIEDNDDMPAVSLSASQDTIAENNGTSNITATITSVSGRDVVVNLGLDGSSSSSDYTLGGETIISGDFSSDGLVLNYTFNGDTTVATDGTTNDNDGTVQGATPVEDRFGAENSAFLFDGEDDYISVPNTESLQIEEDITLSAWVKSESNSNYGTEYIIHSQGSYTNLRLDDRDNRTRFQPYARGAGSHDFVGANNNLANDKWVMLTFTSTKSDDENSNSKTFRMYVNGELERTENRIGNRYNIDKNSPIGIGSNSNGDWHHFKGALDDIRIYNKALTEEEVSNLYASQSVQDVNASITISKGSTTGTIELKAVNDEASEPSETVETTIISATGATISENKVTSVVLTDDDTTSVYLSISSDSIQEGTNQYATVTATLDKVSELPVTVYLNGSGADDTDYIFSSSNDTTGTFATLVAHYKFNGDANDETDNDHDGTNNGATLVEDRFGNPQSAMYFDGVDDNIKVPYVDELKIEKEITVNSWIKVLPKESNTYMRYLSTPDDNWLNVSIHERDNNERYAWRVRSGGYWEETGVECPNNNCNNRPQFDQWYMMTYTLSKELLVDEVTGDTSEIYRGRAYMNGDLVDTSLPGGGSGSNIADVNGDLVIGSSPWDHDYYKGMLDDVRIYKGALSDEEIKSLYSKELVSEENLSSNAIVVLPGNISASNYVFALDDNVFNEPFETLALSIDSIENGVSGSILSGDIVIVDNDITPKASISNVGSSNTIREGTQSYVTIQASLDQVTTRDVTVVLENSGDASDLDFSLSTNNDTTGTVATLVAHYKFNGDANDETDNGLDGTVNGATLVEDRFGNENSAYEFKGGPDYISVPFKETLKIENNISISFWAKLPKNEELYKQRAIITGPGGEGVYSVNIQRRDSDWEVFARGQLINQEVWKPIYPGEDWFHFVFTQQPDSSNENTISKLYYNGQLILNQSIGSGPRSYNNDNGNELFIGTFRPDESWNAFNGILDDVRIYDGTLNDEQISKLYTKELAGGSLFSNSITVPAGQLNSNVYVFAVDDDLFDESDEKAVFAIDTVLNGEVNKNSSSIEIEIEDNDIRPDISIELVERDTITENNDTTYSLIKVSLNQKTTKDVRFKLSANQLNDIDNAIDSDYIISEEKITNSTERNKAEMVAHYKFNGDASDATDNDHDGSVNGATLVEDRFGNAQSAMYFDGVDDNIRIPYLGNLRIEKEITVNSWIRVIPKESNTYMSYLSVQNGSEWLNISIHERDNNERYAWRVRSGGYWDETAVECPNNNCNSRPQFDQWYMMTYTLTKEFVTDDITGETSEIFRGRAYMNGDLVDTTLPGNRSGGEFVNVYGDLVIGSSPWGSDFYRGMLDDIRIYSGSLTSEEIIGLYNLEKSDGSGSTTDIFDNNSFVVRKDSLFTNLYVYPVDDKTYEGFENLSLVIDTADYGKVSLSSADIIIEDNDLLPEVSLNLEKDQISEQTGYDKVNLVATLSNPTGDTVEIPLVYGGDADYGSDVEKPDFSVSGGSIVIYPNTNSAFVEIIAINDSIEEKDETVEIRAVGVKNASDSTKQNLELVITEDICSFVDTDLTGNILEDLTLTKLCGPYMVTGDVLIGNGAVLTIEPGVTIEFAGPNSIKVDGGYIKAIGTEEDSITFTGVSWRGIDVITEGSEFVYTRLVDEGNSGQGDYILKLKGSNISNSLIDGSYAGIFTNDNSSINKSVIRNIRKDAIYLNNSTAYGNILHDVFTEADDNDQYAAVRLNNSSSFTNNLIYSSTEDGNLIAVSPEWGDNIISGNTIGLDNGVHGKFGILQRDGDGYQNKILNNRIGGFKTNVVLIGTTPEFTGNTLMGQVDIDSKEMNVRIANENIQEETQNYPGYIGNGWIWGRSYNSSNTAINMEGNYWSNVSSSEIASTIYDYNDRVDLRGNVNFDNSLSLPSVDAPIAPPKNLVKSISPLGIKLLWSPNEEQDLAGYKLYINSKNSKDAIDLGNVNEYVVNNGNINDTYYLTAYDTDADGNDDQYEGHESWFISSFSAILLNIESSKNAVSELDEFSESTITVSLSSPSPEDISVSLLTSGEAALDKDYTLSSSSLVIEAGELSSSVTLKAINDNDENEEDEIIEISIGEVSSGKLGANSKASVVLSTQICEFIPNTLFGDIEEDMTLYSLCSPYFITGNLLVKEGVTLTIQPGVTVVFSEDRLLRVNGTLIAEGTEQDSITITGFNWKYIDITNNLGGSKIAYADITDESENEWGDWKVKLNRASSLSNSTIHNVPNGVVVGDSSSVNYNTFHDISQTAFELYSGFAYGNTVYGVGSNNGNNAAIKLYYTSDFRNNRVYDIRGGNAAVMTHDNSIIEKNIIGDYSGKHGMAGIVVSNGNDHTIRNNKIGGFISNVVLIGTEPSFIRNSFIGDLNYQRGQRNVVVGNGNVRLYDSLNYNPGIDREFWGQNYNAEQVSVNMRQNYWENIPSLFIDETLEDYNDNFDVVGEIVYSDELLLPDDNTPITPPRGLEITESTLGDYTLSWNENSEDDIAGYNVYTGVNREKVDAGNTTTTQVSIDDVKDFNIELTAYDSDADGVNDIVEGNESLPATDYLLNTLPRAFNDTLRVPINEKIEIPTYPSEESINIGFEFKNNIKDINGVYSSSAASKNLSNKVELDFVDDRFGNENSALSLDGKKYVSVPHDDNLNLNTDNGFTISLWVKLDSSVLQRDNSYINIISKGKDNDNDRWWHLNHSSWWGLRFVYNYNYIHFDRKILDTEWHHISISYQRNPTFGNQRIRLFLDGVLVRNHGNELPEVSDNDGPLSVGNTSTPWENGLSGGIDDVILYNIPLSDQQIIDLYSISKGGNVLSNDIDLDGDVLTSNLVEDVNSGTLILEPDGDVSYEPTQGFSGYDSFTYNITDGSSTSETATVTISVSTPPTAVSDNYSVTEDSVLTVSVEEGILSNDTDPEDDKLQVVLIGDEEYHADLTFNNWNVNSEPDNSDDGDFAIVGDEGFWYDVGYNQTYRFIVEFNDRRNSINDSNYEYLGQWNGHSYFRYNNWVDWNNAKLLSEQTDGGYLVVINSYAENQYLWNITYNDTYWIGYYQDRDDENYSEPNGGWKWVNDGIVKTQTNINGDINISSDGSFVFKPKRNFFGENTFKYFAFDGIQYSDTASVKINVTPVDDRPDARNDYYTIYEDSVLRAISGFTSDLPEEGVVVHYPFDGNRDDFGPSNIELKVYGDPKPAEDRFGNLNGAYYFDGERDFMLGDASSFPKENNSFSVSLWFKSDDVGQNRGYARQLFGFGGPAFNLIFDNPALPSSNSLELQGMEYYLSGEYRFRSKYLYDANTINTLWHNVVVTYIENENASDDDPAGTLKLFFDGEEVMSNMLDMDTETFNKIFTIGAHPNSVGDFVYIYPQYKWFKGSIDDVIVYDRALSISEIEQLSSTSFASVLANDREVDGQTMTANLISDVSNGDLVFNDNGKFVYKPDPEFYGYDTLTYIASDGQLLSDTTTVLITIIEVDDVPIALPDSFEINEDDSLSVAPENGVLSNDIDVDGDEIISELVMSSANGTLTLNFDGSFDYKPIENFNGLDTFKYVTKDELNVTDSIPVVITINPVNDKPVSDDDFYVLETGNVLTINADSIGILGNDVDIDGDTLYSTVLDDTKDGVLSLDSSGSFTYTPNLDTYVGVDTFTYQASDLLLSDTATVVIRVTDRPVAVPDTFSVFEDNCLKSGNFMEAPSNETMSYTYTSENVLSNDSDQDAESLTVILVETTLNGELFLSSDGEFEYCPNPNFNGTDVFTYVITDSYLYSDTVSVVININPVNDSPEGNEDKYGLLKDQILTIDSLEGVLSNDIDVDGDTLTASLISDVEEGTLEFNSNGSFSYTPPEGFLGEAIFTYSITDQTFETSAITATIVVTARPVAKDIEYSVFEDSILSVSSVDGYLSNDTDEDNVEDLIGQLISPPINGEFAFLEDGSFEYIPSENYNGNDSFTYVVSDGILTSDDTATVSILIVPVNDAPNGVSDSYSVDEGGTLTVSAEEGLLVNDDDIDSDSIYSGSGTDPLYGTVTINPDGSFTYTNNGNNAPVDVFTYKVFDTLGLSSEVEVSISINPSNDVPIILPGQTLSIDENPDINQIIGQVSVDDENIQSDLSGQYSIVTDQLWCSDDNQNVFEGDIVFERISTNEFGVNILTSSGKTLNGDYSFGGYFTCYDGYEGTPGGSLRLLVDENGLSITGSSQWGEVFSFDTVIYDGQDLEIHWSNSSGESAVSTITRDDDIQWVDLIAGGSSNTGFTWSVISGNENNAVEIDNLGNLYVNNPDVFDFEETQSISISLTANDGVFTSDEENVTVSINNVWDMKISSTTIEDAYCGGGSTGSISLDVIGNEGSVSVIWRKGNEEIFNGDESGLSITDLYTGLYSVTITDDVGSITENYQIVSPPIYNGLDVCYVSADTTDITKNRIFINEGQNPYNIAKFLIYREGSVANQYDKIGEIDVSSGEGSYLDDVDNRVRAYRYKVAIEDNCGNVSDLNDVEHVTNHLTANQGIGGEINLLWSGYEGMFVPTYQIYKSVDDGEFELLTEVSSNNTSYTDLDVNPANSYKYFIGFEADVNCVAEIGGEAFEFNNFDEIENVYIPNAILEEGASYVNPTYGSSYITNTTGLKGKRVIRSSPFFLEAEPPVEDPLAVESIIIESVDKVYPNPASQIVYIDLADDAGDIEKLYFIDFSGKVIDNVRFKQTKDKAAVDIEVLESGIYLLDVTTKLGHSRVKVVIQK